MGPISLFDKSFIQALSLNEACMFDQFFSSVLCPIYITEVLADLSKPGRNGRLDDRVVAALAEKAPCVHSYPNMFHKDLMWAELFGQRIDMSSRPHVGGGHYARTTKGVHIAHDEPPEMIAFSRWQAGNFWEVERDFASAWREAVEKIDLKAIKNALQNSKQKFREVRNLSDVRSTASQLVSAEANQWALLKLIASSIEVGGVNLRKIQDRWSKAGRPPIREYAPYCTFVLEVDLFFELALMKSMIGDSRPSNRIDIAYLYYLPFCQLFISRDKLHKRTVPLFLNERQRFVWGDQLKSDLNAIHDHLISLPLEVRETGLMKFAKNPPAEVAKHVAALWDQFCPGWRDRRPTPKMTPEKEAQLLAELKKGTDAPRMPSHMVPRSVRTASPQSMHFSRSIPIKRGDWYVLPKDINN